MSVNMSVPSDWWVPVWLLTNKIAKMLSHLSALYFLDVMEYINFNSAKSHIYCMWEIGCNRLDRIYIFAFTVCTAICWRIISLRYRKGKDQTVLQHRIAQRKTLQNWKCQHRKHPLGRTVHAALYGELQCSLSTPPDAPVCGATDFHPHHIRQIP